MKKICPYREGDFCNYPLDCYRQEYIPPYEKPLCDDSVLDILDDPIKKGLERRLEDENSNNRISNGIE